MNATMVVPPPGNGLVLIHDQDKPLLMLSGDSIETLKWTELDLKLQHHPRRNHHISFNIPNDLLDGLGYKMNKGAKLGGATGAGAHVVFIPRREIIHIFASLFVPCPEVYVHPRYLVKFGASANYKWLFKV